MMDELELAVERMRAEGADFCDARYQVVTSTGMAVVDAAVRRVSEDRLRGACLRARKRGSWGYATTVDVSKEAMMEAAAKAVRNAQAGTAQGKILPDRGGAKADLKAQVQLHPSKVGMDQKVQAVLDMDRAQRVDPRIVNTNAVLREDVRENMLVNSHDKRLSWEEVRSTIMVQSIAHEAGRTEFFYDIRGGSMGFEVVKDTDLEAFGRDVGNEAIKMLSAEKAPSGLVTCITDPSYLRAAGPRGHGARLRGGRDREKTLVPDGHGGKEGGLAAHHHGGRRDGTGRPGKHPVRRRGHALLAHGDHPGRRVPGVHA